MERERERERAGTNIREKKNNTEGAAIGKSEKKKKKRGGRVAAIIRRAQPEQLVIDGTCYFFRRSPSVCTGKTIIQTDGSKSFEMG